MRGCYRMRISRALAVAVVCLSAAPAARAVPLHFDNPAPGEPGHADWLDLQFINITLSASQQDAVDRPGAIEFFETHAFDPFLDPQGSTSGTIAAGGGGRLFTIFGQFALLDPGELIGPSGLIPTGTGDGVYADFFTDGVLVGSDLVGPLGEHFLGVRFWELDGPNIVGWHYGYIGFNLLERADGTHGLFATSWGYETDLDTDIVIIPAPGALGALALCGGMGLNGRSRRRPPA